jgi:hypothetical protein
MQGGNRQAWVRGGSTDLSATRPSRRRMLYRGWWVVRVGGEREKRAKRRRVGPGKRKAESYMGVGGRRCFKMFR